MSALLTADRDHGWLDAERNLRDVEAEPVIVSVQDGQAIFALDDGEELVFGLDTLLDALGAVRYGQDVTVPTDRRSFLSRCRKALRREPTYLGCLSNDDIDRMDP